MTRMTLPAWLSAVVPIIAQMGRISRGVDRPGYHRRVRHRRRGLADRRRLSGNRRAAAGGRPLCQHSADDRLRDLRFVAAAHRRSRRRDDDHPRRSLSQLLATRPEAQASRDIRRLGDCRRPDVPVVAAARASGFIANFLSRPILTGYLCGISLTLLIGQIGRVTTVHLESKGVLRPLFELSGRLEAIHAADTGVRRWRLHRRCAC